MEKKADYFVWFYDDQGELHRNVISAWNPDDAKDIFSMAGGDIYRIDKVELTAKYNMNLQNKLDQWKKGEKPCLSSNEAVVVWFCTGDEPKELPDGPPYIKFLHLTETDRSFIDSYERE